MGLRFARLILEDHPGIEQDLADAADKLWSDSTRYTGSTAEKLRMHAVVVRRALDVVQELRSEPAPEAVAYETAAGRDRWQAKCKVCGRDLAGYETPEQACVAAEVHCKHVRTSGVDPEGPATATDGERDD